MQINKNLKIESDGYGVKIFKKISKDGEEPVWNPIGYYSEPKAALRGLLKLEVNGTGMKDLQTVVDKIEEVKKLIESLDFKKENNENGVMEVKVVILTDEEIERRDYRDAVAIIIDGERSFRVQDDEPEDSNLSRSFSDVYNIPELMQKAYEAGKNGKSFSLTYEQVEEI